MAKYKFEEIAINSTEKKKPIEEDKYTYLGLEHLDSCNLTVSRYGADVAPIGEKLIMKKGDVLFGKRRAYQKKVAIAPFDGIFSAHGMVLRPKTEVVNKKFFPFFIASDYFLDKAIQISVGSLSPTVNWGTLRNVEFNLPDINEQEKLAELLWAANDTKEAYKKLLILTDELVKSQFIKVFGDPVENPNEWETKALSEIADYFIGLTYKPDNVVDDGILVLRSGNIQNSVLSFEDIVRVNMEVKEKLLVKKNDILMCSRNGSAALVGKVAKIPDLEEEMTFGAFMTIIRSEYHAYLFSFFQQDAFRRQLTQAKTSTINQITKSMLNNVKVPIPPMELQNQFAEFVKQVDKAKIDLQQTVLGIENTIKSLLQQHFG
jgi:type I restriction enzyme, S subunit